VATPIGNAKKATSARPGVWSIDGDEQPHPGADGAQASPTATEASPRRSTASPRPGNDPISPEQAEQDGEAEQGDQRGHHGEPGVAAAQGMDHQPVGRRVDHDRQARDHRWRARVAERVERGAITLMLA
jgi:hypothetical protein